MKIKKVLLISPPAFMVNITNMFRDLQLEPPMGLAYLGAVAEREGIEVKIVDSLLEGWENAEQVDDHTMRAGLYFPDIEKIIREFAPDVVGISCLFTKQRENGYEIGRITKQISNKIVTVMGGPHPTVCPDDALKEESIDYIVLGEGEVTFIDLIHHLEGTKDIKEMDGIGYRENGEPVIVPRTNFIEDLDTLPLPARHLLKMDKYYGIKESHGMRKKTKYSPIITSRGCPFKCVFCTAHKVWGKKFRARSPENVVEEMRLLKRDYGIEELMFEDDNVTLDVKRAEKIFDLMIEEKLDFCWDTPNGVAAFTLNKPLIKKMVDSGCYKINLALESGSQEHLTKNIKKPLRLVKMPAIVDYIRELGCDVGMFIVIGVPGETEEMMWESFRLAAKLRVFSPHISIATPYPGSELYDMSRQRGYIKKDFTLDDLFIRSFSLVTPEWDGAKLKRIYEAGRRWLLIQHFKKAPLSFIWKYLNILKEADLMSIKYMLKEIGIFKK